MLIVYGFVYNWISFLWNSLLTDENLKISKKNINASRKYLKNFEFFLSLIECRRLILVMFSIFWLWLARTFVALDFSLKIIIKNTDGLSDFPIKASE